MTKYWVKSDASSLAEGPMDGAGLRERAIAGTVTGDSLISVDQTSWHPAGRVKGLFDSAPVAAPATKAPAVPQPPLIRQAPPAPLRPAVRAPALAASGLTAPPPMPASVGYFVPGGGSVTELKPRKVFLYWIVAGASFLLYGVIFFQFNVARKSDSFGNAQIFTLFGTLVGFLLLMLPSLILWLMWVHGTHKDVRELTGGHQISSPGQAVGLSFIPVFDAFWIVYMPWRLTKTINDQLAVAGLAPIMMAGVLICQILSIPAAFLFPGLTPVLYAASMTTIQRGLDRLRLSGVRHA